MYTNIHNEMEENKVHMLKVVVVINCNDDDDDDCLKIH